MSYLIRTGTGRTNIKWGGGKSTKAKYLRRTGTGRNNISWIDISSNGTYNVLERTSSGRNNIRWYNTTFTFTDPEVVYLVNTIVNSNNGLTLLSKTGSPSYYSYQLKYGDPNPITKISDDTIQLHLNGTVTGPVTSTTYFIFEITRTLYNEIKDTKSLDYTEYFTCDITTTDTRRCDLGDTTASNSSQYGNSYFIRNADSNFRIGGYVEYPKIKFMPK